MHWHLAKSSKKILSLALFFDLDFKFIKFDVSRDMCVNFVIILSKLSSSFLERCFTDIRKDPRMIQRKIYQHILSFLLNTPTESFLAISMAICNKILRDCLGPNFKTIVNRYIQKDKSFVLHIEHIAQYIDHH